MSTRAASAASSRKATQDLVRVLFGSKYAKKGPKAHKRLDYSRYSHDELRRAFLARAQELHPDKSRSLYGSCRQTSNDAFAELQSAWDCYEKIAKTMKRTDNGRQTAFTRFGVGCSFSDSDLEKQLRDEITDQACRGWLPSGSIEDGHSAKRDCEEEDDVFPTSSSSNAFKISLLEDGDFVAVSNNFNAQQNVRNIMRKDLIGSFRPKAKR